MVNVGKSALLEWFSMPGITQALIDSYEADAEEMDARIQAHLHEGTINTLRLWDGPGEVGTRHGRWLDAVDVLEGRNAEERAASWNRHQVRSIALRDYAERIRAADEFGIGFGRFLRITGNAVVFDVALPDLVKAGIVVRGKDQIRLARPGETLHQ